MGSTTAAQVMVYKGSGAFPNGFQKDFNTHYVDPNGLSSGSVSSAADQLRVAVKAMAMPTLHSCLPPSNRC